MVEFDDLGWYWNRSQKEAVVAEIADLATRKDLLIVVFAHGWNHNASPHDSNLNDFQKILENLALLENQAAERKCMEAQARQVVGVYLGWRGKAFLSPSEFPGALYNWSSFWTRKATAHRVGGEGAAELLRELERIRDRRILASPDSPRTSRLVVAGHSFGSAVVYGALSRILAARRPTLLNDTVEEADFGDLVVLVNPAIEASLLFPFEESAEKARRDKGSALQSKPTFHPVMSVFSSQGDGATGVTFKIGRWFSTFLKRHRSDNPPGHTEPSHFQGVAARTAVGHFRPTISHLLCPNGEVADIQETSCTSASRASSESGSEKAVPLEPLTTDEVASQLGAVAAAQLVAPSFSQGTVSKLQLRSATLWSLRPGQAMTPYPIVAVDRRLIRNHNDIFTRFFAPFLVEFVAVWNEPIPSACAGTTPVAEQVSRPTGGRRDLRSVSEPVGRRDSGRSLASAEFSAERW